MSDFNKRSYGKNNNTPRNMNTDVHILETESSGDFNYLLGLLEDLDQDGIFEVISVPIHMRRSEIENNPEKKGTINVGYCRGFNPNTKMFEITIFAKHIEKFKSIGSGAIFVKGRLYDNEMKTILALEYVKA